MSSRCDSFVVVITTSLLMKYFSWGGDFLFLIIVLEVVLLTF